MVKKEIDLKRILRILIINSLDDPKAQKLIEQIKSLSPTIIEEINQPHKEIHQIHK